MLLKRVITVIIVCAGSCILANQWHDDADRYWNEAQKLKKNRDYKQAIEYLKRAVVAERRNENPRSEELIAQLNELGQLYDVTGNYEKALHYFKLMLTSCRKYKNADQEAMALNSIGLTYFNLNRFDEAMGSYREAFEVSRKNGYRDKMVLVLNNMALVYRVTRDFNRARDSYEEALSYARDSGSTMNLAVLTSNAGTMYYFMGEYDRALDLYVKALEIDRRRGGDADLSIDLSNIGRVYAAKGRYGEALNYYEKALEIDTGNKNERNMAARWYRIGDVYFRVGDNTRALEFYNKSLGLNLRLNDTINAASVQNSIGQVYDSMGRNEEALDSYIKALGLNKDVEMKENIAARLSDIGLLYAARERYGDAVDYIGKALVRDIKSEKKNRIADNMSNIGRVMVSLKKYDMALDYFRQAMDIYREVGDRVSIADDSKNSGIVHYNMKDYTRAGEYFIQAREMIDSVKDGNSISIANVKNDIFRWLIASQIKDNKPEKAYESNEAFCIGKIYALISDSAPDQRIKSINYEKLKKNIGKKTGLVVFANIIWDNPYVIYIDSDNTAGFELDKAAAVNALYNVLGKDIESFIGKKKTDIIFNVSQKSRRDYYYIEFEKIINYYRALLSKKYISSKEFEIQKTIGRILYRFLFNKIDNYIAGKETLVIQPDGVLSTIPFETMIMNDGRFLIEKFGVRYTFSQTCEDYFSDRIYGSGRKGMAIMGGFNSPPQPTAREIESTRHFEMIADGIIKRITANKSVLELFGFFGVDDLMGLKAGTSEINELKALRRDIDTITGDQGTESALAGMSTSGRLGNYRILHVISKGVVVPEVPQLSSLLVSYDKKEGPEKDGVLNVRKISTLGLRSDIVHLAAIAMPAAGYSRGEGIWNLCGSIMVGGSRGVSLSVWNLDEATRSYFMKQVYEAVLNRNIPVEKAFTQTKRAFIQGEPARSGSSALKPEGDEEGKLSNPYFWGSFLYYGR